MPGAHNGQAALQAHAAGVEGLYLSGAAMSASMGLPDLGLITIKDVTFFIPHVAASGLPSLVDAYAGCPDRSWREVFSLYRRASGLSA